jgi:serine/threonine protein kinase/tetratricopeptide (TPR) repeat protein
MRASVELGHLNTHDWEQLQSLADRLEEAWKGGDAVDLNRFLPHPGDPLRPLVLRELIKTDLEIQWRRGQTPTLDAYVKQFPELGATATLPAELIYEEYRARQRYGDQPTLARYRARFPERYAELLRLVRRQSLRVSPAAAGPSPAPQRLPESHPVVTPMSDNWLPVGDGYTLIEKIGSGGFADVWRAERRGGFPVAIKVMRQLMDQEAAQQELKSLELIKRLTHPFLLQTQASYIHEERLLIVMDLADGSLRKRLKECQKQGLPGIPPAELIGYFLEAAEALDYLHSEGVLHRDIKPENLLLLRRHVKVADFGLARAHDHTMHSASVSGAGTPAYMAPEVWKNRPSRKSDQYSLAFAYAELRLGRPLFRYENLFQMMFAQNEETPDLSPLPQAEQDALLRAMAKDKDQRYRNCLRFVQALRKALQGKGVLPEPEPDSKNDSEPKRPTWLPAVGYRQARLVGPSPSGELWHAVTPGGDPVRLRVSYPLDYAAAHQRLEVLQLGKGFDHPHWLKLHDYWLIDPQGTALSERAAPDPAAPVTLVVAEELATANLAGRLDQCRQQTGKGLPVPELLKYLKQAAEAIDALNAPRHALGQHKVALRHCGISPESLQLVGGTVKVSDLSRAQAVHGSPAPFQGVAADLTPGFAAPELFDQPRRVTASSDQYSLAITYYLLRTGSLPFNRSHSHLELIPLQLKGQLDFSRLTGPELQVIARATSLRPEERFPTCAALVDALERALPGAEEETRPYPPAQGARQEEGRDKPPVSQPLVAADVEDLWDEPTETGSGREPDRQPVQIGEGDFYVTLPPMPEATPHDTPDQVPGLNATVLPGTIASLEKLPEGASSQAEGPPKQTHAAPAWRGSPTDTHSKGRGRPTDLGGFASQTPPPDGRVPAEEQPEAEEWTAKEDRNATWRLPARQSRRLSWSSTWMFLGVGAFLGLVGLVVALSRVEPTVWSQAYTLLLSTFPKPREKTPESGGGTLGAVHPTRDDCQVAIAAAIALLDKDAQIAVDQLNVILGHPNVGDHQELRQQALLGRARAYARLNPPQWERVQQDLRDLDLAQDKGLAADPYHSATKLALEALAETGDAAAAWDRLGQLPELMPLLDEWERTRVAERGKIVVHDPAVIRRLDAMQDPDQVLDLAKALLAFDDQHIEVRAQVEEIRLLKLAQEPARQTEAAGKLEEVFTTRSPRRLVPLFEAYTALALGDKNQAYRPGAVRALAKVFPRLGPREKARVQAAYHQLLTAEIKAWVPRLAERADFEKVLAYCDEAATEGASAWVHACLAECLIETRGSSSSREWQRGEKAAADALKLPNPPAYAHFVRARYYQAGEKPDWAAAADALLKALPSGSVSPELKVKHRSDRAICIFEEAAQSLRSGTSLNQAFQSPAAAARGYLWLKGAYGLKPANEKGSVPLRVALALAAWEMPDRDARLAQQLTTELRRELPPAQLREAVHFDAYRVLLVHARTLMQESSLEAKKGAVKGFADLVELATHTDEIPGEDFHESVLASAIKLGDELLDKTQDPELQKQVARLHFTRGELIRHSLYLYEPWVKNAFARPVEEAHRAYDRAVALQPTEVDYLVRRADCRLLLPEPKWNDLEATAREVLKRHPNSVAGLALRSRVLHFKALNEPNPGKSKPILESAAVEYQKAIELCKQHGDPTKERALLLTGRSGVLVLLANYVTDPQRRKEYLGQAVREAQEATGVPDRPYPEYAWESLGNALEDLGWLVGEADAYPRAIEEFKRALAARPNRIQILVSRGRCRYKWARNLLDSLRKQNRQPDAEVVNLLGLACDDLKEAVDKDPESPEAAEACYWLGMVYRLPPRLSPTQADFYFEQADKLTEQFKLRAWAKCVLQDWTQLALEQANVANGGAAKPLAAARERAERLRKYDDARGMAYLKQTYVVEAERSLREATHVKEKDPAAKDALLEKARDCANRLRGLGERLEAAWILGESYFVDGKVRQALTELKGELPQKPEHAERVHLLVLIHYTRLLRSTEVPEGLQPAPRELVRITDRLVELTSDPSVGPETRAFALGSAGHARILAIGSAGLNAREKTEYRDEALKRLREALRLAPQHDDAWLWRYLVGQQLHGLMTQEKKDVKLWEGYKTEALQVLDKARSDPRAKPYLRQINAERDAISTRRPPVGK